MCQRLRILAIAAVLALCPAVTMAASADRFDRDDDYQGRDQNVQLGPRPFSLVDQMEKGQLKNKLQACVANITRWLLLDSRVDF
jgi:glycerophosphoryl diester phosphodiesterase